MALQDKALLRQQLAAIGLSFGVGVILMAVKFYAYRLTRSSAILSDALESIINVVASGFALISVWFSAQPPDESHPYGHGKIEYFSAGFEGALIMAAAAGIMKTGWNHLVRPQSLPNLSSGLALILAAALVNLLLGLKLIRTGRASASLALEADGRHVITDFISSAVVVAGLVVVSLSGWLWLDGALALAAGVHVMWSGGRLVHQAFGGLMDRSQPELLDEVAAVIQANRRPCWIDVHQLRAWRAGPMTHIDLHLILPTFFSLEKAHAEAKSLEHTLMAHYENRAAVLIHMDPCADPDCPACRLSACAARAAPGHDRPASWTGKSATRPGRKEEPPA
jgi:cation diffusion facilitator family transporter